MQAASAGSPVPRPERRPEHWPKVRQNITFGPKANPLFLVKHFTKAGGTFARWVLMQAVKENKYSWNIDDSSLSMKQRRESFTVVIVRNPCDWYISWAHFNAGKAFNYKQETFGPDPFPPGGKPGQLDRDDFKKWFTNVRFPDGKGFLSYYVWHTFIAPECFMLYSKHFKGEADPNWPRCSNRTHMWEDLANFKPLEQAHCWVFHETFMEDFRNCLKAYELSCLKHQPGVINWTRFEDIATGRRKYTDPKKSLSNQHKRHKPCEYFFNESGIDDGPIMDSDPFLFDKFGYKSCCKPRYA